jgi:hypothetical protein
MVSGILFGNDQLHVLQVLVAPSSHDRHSFLGEEEYRYHLRDYNSNYSSHLSYPTFFKGFCYRLTIIGISNCGLERVNRLLFHDTILDGCLA